MKLPIHFGFVSFPECRGEDTVTQSTGVLTPTEGETVTLDCNFDTTDSNPNLFWYKMEVKDFPRYMLRQDKYTDGDNSKAFPKERFDAQLNFDERSVPLRIQSVQLSDAAVYYCALRPTVTTGDTDHVQKPAVLHNTGQDND